jgi:hypothetical protein
MAGQSRDDQQTQGGGRTVADKSSQLVLSALTRATSDAAGVYLHGTKSAPGLFPTTAIGKQAARRCCDEGYLRPVAEDECSPPAEMLRSRAASGPICTITDKGLAFLLSQVSPREVLEDFVRVLESREAQVMQLVNLARQMQASFEALRASIAPVLAEVARSPFPSRQAGNGDLKGLFHEFRETPPNKPDAQAREHKPDAQARDYKPDALARETVLAHLDRWASPCATEDCSLPELFRQARMAVPGLTIGAFHDTLRALQDAGDIYLHPWTGPLYDIPEPPYALLVGHELAYYASRAR